MNSKNSERKKSFLPVYWLHLPFSFSRTLLIPWSFWFKCSIRIIFLERKMLSLCELNTSFLIWNILLRSCIKSLGILNLDLTATATVSIFYLTENQIKALVKFSPAVEKSMERTQLKRFWKNLLIKKSITNIRRNCYSVWSAFWRVEFKYKGAKNWTEINWSNWNLFYLKI